MNSLEIYILKTIKELKIELAEHIKQKDATYNFGGKQLPVYPDKQYWEKFHRIAGQISILYRCLTAHDNTYHLNPKL